MYICITQTSRCTNTHMRVRSLRPNSTNGSLALCILASYILSLCASPRKYDIMPCVGNFLFTCRKIYMSAANLYSKISVCVEHIVFRYLIR